jgi:hypothetical protein
MVIDFSLQMYNYEPFSLKIKYCSLDLGLDQLTAGAADLKFHSAF